ncbi:MAG: hypothetical protein IKZ82_13775 [Clostridia bacterium]|nr:hypothetical protein [Clostridia bacterium]
MVQLFENRTMEKTVKLERFKIFQIPARNIIATARKKGDGYSFEFDPYDDSSEYLVEKTYQDDCPMFYQAKAVLRELGIDMPFGEDCLSETFIYIDFSGIFDRKPVGRVKEQQEIAAHMFREEGIEIYKRQGSCRYVAFERSASMSHKNVLAFVREEVYEPLRKRMMLGMTIGKCQLSKLYAYNGLMFTNGFRCLDCSSLTDDSIIVIDNPKSIVRDADIITVEDDGTDAPVRKYSRVEKTADIEVLEFDGEGIISKEFASRLAWSGEHHSFQIRLPYIKGVVHEVDIKKLFAELKVPVIRDIWGTEHDVRKVEMIITKSMFKGFGWMTENGLSWREYLERCGEYGRGLYVSGMDKNSTQDTTELNYQFLNTLAIDRELFRPADLPSGWESSPANDERQWLTKTTEERYWSYIADPDFRRRHCIDELEDTEETPSQRRKVLLQAAIKNPLLLEEPILAREFEKKAESIRNDYALGRLLVAGDNRYLSDDLMRLLGFIVKNSAGEGKAYSLLEKEFLRGNEMYAPLPGYKEQEIYTLLRSPHIARNEEALAVPLSDVGKLRKKYLSHLSYVLMVDSRSLIPERLGGADYDGDMIKTIADPIVNGCVFHGYEASGSLPVLKIPAAEPLISYANDWQARLDCVRSTFSSRVGQISNAALRRGIAAYDENSDSEEREFARMDTEVLAILTGLEIDSAKSGVKPDLSEYLEKRKGKKSLFLRYKNIVDDAEDRKWYEATTLERIKNYIGSVKWDNVSSDLERLPYYAYMLEKGTPKHEPKPAPSEELFAFAKDPNWRDTVDPHTMEQTKAIISAYREALSRIRYIKHLPADRRRRSDIEQILYSRGQENDYSLDELYALFDFTAPITVRKARAKLSETKWHLLPKEERETALYDFNIHALLRKAELFCDFSCSGYRVLGDLICDVDDMNRKNDIAKHIIRKGDGSDIKYLLSGVKLHGNYEERITLNCVNLIDPPYRDAERLSENEVLKCAEALGEREFALKVLPAAVMRNVSEPVPRKRGRKKK